MALASAVKGSKRPAQVVTWTRSDGVAESLIGATLTGFIRNVATEATRAIDGTLTVTNAAAGIFTWTYGDNDISETGYFEVQFNAAFGSAPTPAKTVIADWYVSDQLSV